MAADKMNAEARAANIRSRWRLLGVAYLVFFAALVVLGSGIVLFGSSRSGEPAIRLQISLSRSRDRHTEARERSAAVPDSVAVFTSGAPAADAAKPRIAIIIGGLGVSANATAAALASLPPQVTLSFVPYAADVQNWVTLARRQGHEVLLELPMESFDFPDSDPGPHTLRVGAGEDANTERLVWALTRFTGYTGVTNLLGGRLLSDSDSLEPVFAYLARRGLLFFDNGIAAHSAAPEVAAHTGILFAQSSVTIDSIQTAMEIDRELAELENQARTHGTASGSGFIYPVTLERVAHWAAGLDGRGFVLVPASAIVSAKK